MDEHLQLPCQQTSEAQFARLQGPSGNHKDDQDVDLVAVNISHYGIDTNIQRIH